MNMQTNGEYMKTAPPDAAAERIDRYADLVRKIVERIGKERAVVLTSRETATRVTSGSEVEPRQNNNSNNQ